MVIAAENPRAHVYLQPKYENGYEVFDFLGLVYELENIYIVIEFLLVPQCSERVTPSVHCDLTLQHA